MSAFSVSNENGIAVVTFDLPGEPVNKLTADVIDEFGALLTRLAQDGTVRGVVLRSGKPDNFIAGADIEQFARLRSHAEATAMSRTGQEIAARVADFPKPFVIAIHGACLGGGFELALACHWRVISDSPKTQLGLPEVQLGIIPGVGGTQRLPRLVGARAALDMILAGRNERAEKAFRLGMADELVPESILRQVAVAAAERMARNGVPQRKARGGMQGFFLDRTPIGRRIVYAQAEKQVLARTGGHYPAPLAALTAVRTGLEQGMQAGLREESRLFGELAMSDVSRNLVRIFFATTALKKDDGVPGAEGLKVPPVRRLAVVGAGFMGAAIAGTAVLNAEVEARLKDADLPRVGKGIRSARRILDDRLKRRRLTRPKHERLTDLLSGAADYSGFLRADMVIEAVFEDLAVKRKVLAEVERETRDTAIFATNTSTIPIGEIAAGASRPEQVVGMHFFSPVEKMPLLEVIPHAGTAPETVVRAVRFGRKMGKTAIVVGDSPGFWVNRILLPYMNEAGIMVREGVPMDIIDRAMTEYGFPVGPITLLDEVGLDVGAKVAKVMHEAYGERLAPSDVLDRMLADDRQGRKNGRGFYEYKDGKKAGPDPSVATLLGTTPQENTPQPTVERRLLYAMLNEAAMAAHEGVIHTPRDGDIGAIFGIGYPAFRGGPLRTIDTLGPARVAETLRELANIYGPRFRPAESLVAMADRGERFYPGDD
ncbi:MAG TPA: fatty acid oxidation complex subunit alpha FadJ [Gemmatimonadales bacterium]|nr:fatty acid oxidation complex subunit alpha FadJ [Gemmatimonadales bacterium]